VTLSAEEDREPVADYQCLRHELQAFDPALAERPEIVVLSQGDLTEVREAFGELEQRFAEIGVKLRMISAVTGDGIDQLKEDLAEILRTSAAEL
jgi:GTP-binding protein